MKKSLHLAAFTLCATLAALSSQADDKEAARYTGKLVEVEIGLGRDRSIIKTCTLKGIGKAYDVAKVRGLITAADKDKTFNEHPFVAAAENSVKVVAHLVTEIAPNDGEIKTKPVPLVHVDGVYKVRKGDSTKELLKIAEKACGLEIVKLGNIKNAED